MDFFGAFFFTILSFIAPILIYSTNTKQELSFAKKVLNVTIVIIGIVFGITNSYNSFMKMFRLHD